MSAKTCQPTAEGWGGRLDSIAILITYLWFCYIPYLFMRMVCAGMVRKLADPLQRNPGNIRQPHTPVIQNRISGKCHETKYIQLNYLPQTCSHMALYETASSRKYKRTSAAENDFSGGICLLSCLQ